MKPQLFLDMDGVLIDWNSGVHALHDIPLTPGVWPYKLGPAGWNFHRQLGMTTEQLFKGQDRKFWANLQWITDGKEILEVCEKYFDDTICLLTSPYDADGVVDGRKDWIKREMPKYVERHLIGAYKTACAHPAAILIDDYEDNVQNWRKAGGIGILVPRPYNSLWSASLTPAAWVEFKLNNIFKGTVAI